MAYVFDPIVDFQEHIALLREDPEKKEIVEKYETIYGPILWWIKDQIWYHNYISHFRYAEILLPPNSKDDFDRELLLQLVVASLSSECILQSQENDLPSLCISVNNWWTIITKKVEELYGFQLFSLFKIYIEEQLSMQIHLSQEEEKDEVTSQRAFRIKKWHSTLDYISDKAAMELSQKQQAQDLLSLYDKL